MAMRLISGSRCEPIDVVGRPSMAGQSSFSIYCATVERSLAAHSSRMDIPQGFLLGAIGNGRWPDS